ncbi:MAG: protein TolR [Bdellovibrionales bacterium RIFCSPHIGHO2_01_FULL_40_29]|nr:MAG: protein TolR [Bdellovibrionales bacterium RIFCSPHIGHO2_01_FULL_40_29]OFZ35050.1 MAG: protein TolR [Bdellovibrionales bacterium RIFCSPHIGHO2_02_FULL_40_15]
MAMSPQSSRGHSKTVMSEINVTPFVDVMLVLLIIFMVTTPLMQQGIEVNLPKTAASGVDLQEDPFVLLINAKGQVKVGDIEIEIDQMKEKLKAIFDIRKNKQIYIQADTKVDYGVVAQAMAEIRAAGIFNINLITIPKD